MIQREEREKERLYASKKLNLNSLGLGGAGRAGGGGAGGPTAPADVEPVSGNK